MFTDDGPPTMVLGEERAVWPSTFDEPDTDLPRDFAMSYQISANNLVFIRFGLKLSITGYLGWC